MVRAGDVKAGYLNLEKTLKVTESIYKEFTRNHIPKAHDIVMSRVGTYFVTSFVKTKQPFCLGQNTVVIHSAKNPKFLYYALISQIVKRQIEQLLVGSGGQETLSLKNIRELKIPYPPLSEQEVIQRTLSALDDKIELNRQMNEALEDVGAALFKRWFVDFEFPNQEGKPYKSTGGKMVDTELDQIPESWLLGHYCDLVEVSTGKGLSRDRLVDDGKYPVLGANGELGRTDDFLYHEKLILTGRVGTLGKVYLSNEKVWISDNVLISKAKSTCNYHYSYFVLKSFDMEALNRGSTQPLVTQTDLKNQTVIIPDEKILMNFEVFLSTLYSKVNLNNQQNKTLSAIRDNLLPKLMSGKIRVPLNK